MQASPILVSGTGPDRPMLLSPFKRKGRRRLRENNPPSPGRSPGRVKSGILGSLVRVEEHLVQMALVLPSATFNRLGHRTWPGSLAALALDVSRRADSGRGGGICAGFSHDFPL